MTTRPVGPPPLASPKVATLGDVLNASRRQASKQAGTPEPPPAPPSMDDVNNKLAQAVAMKANMAILESANGAQQHPQEGFGSQAAGLGALITAMGAVMKQGGDPADAKLQIAEYIAKHDEASVRAEIAEIRKALTEPSGNSTLETISVLKEMDMLRKGNDGGGILDQIRAMKELGLIPAPAAVVQPPSLVAQLSEMMQVMNMIRPPQPATPASVIQFPGGGSLTIGEYLQVEDWKAKRQDAAQQREMAEKRLAVTQENLPKVWGFLGRAIEAYSRSKADGVADKDMIPSNGNGTAAKVLPPQPAAGTVKCLGCGEIMEYPMSVGGQAIDQVQCSECQAIVDLSGKVLVASPPKPQAPAAAPPPAAPAVKEAAHA